MALYFGWAVLALSVIGSAASLASWAGYGPQAIVSPWALLAALWVAVMLGAIWLVLAERRLARLEARESFRDARGQIWHRRALLALSLDELARIRDHQPDVWAWFTKR